MRERERECVCVCAVNQKKKGKNNKVETIHGMKVIIAIITKVNFLNVVSDFYASFYVHLYVDVCFYCKNFAVYIRKLS